MACEYVAFFRDRQGYYFATESNIRSRCDFPVSKPLVKLFR